MTWSLKEIGTSAMSSGRGWSTSTERSQGLIVSR